MVKTEELTIGGQYYVPGYCGAEKVTLVAIEGSKAVVKTKKSKPFYRGLQFLFQDIESANRAKRTWESNMRKKK